MIFVTFEKDGIQRGGILNGSGMVYDLKTDILSGIEQGDEFVRYAQAVKDEIKDADKYQLSEVTLCAPIPRPHKNIFCIGKNYKDHAVEMGGVESIPEHPVVFSKAPTTVIGHEAVIMADASVTQEVDYEGELGIVIGKEGRNISREQAMEHVFGYTIINDVTARDLQERHKQYLIGKSLDTFCPMGPFLVHASEIPDPTKLRIETRVNGEVRQSCGTDQMIFDIPTLLSVLSAGMTLEPGDIISTGTPSGVGKGFRPPRLLKDGDVVEVEITSIGVLRNRVAIHTK